jgi:hypothetical protein
MDNYKIVKGVLAKMKGISDTEPVICPFKTMAPGQDKLGRLIFYHQYCSPNCIHFIDKKTKAVINCGAEQVEVNMVVE